MRLESWQSLALASGLADPQSPGLTQRQALMAWCKMLDQIPSLRYSDPDLLLEARTALESLLEALPGDKMESWAKRHIAAINRVVT